MKKSASWFASLVLAVTMGAGISTVMNAGATAKPAPVTFYACLKAGALSNVTTLKHSCARGYSAVSWNQVGEMGLTGAKGATGLTGPRGLQGVKGDAGEQGLKGDSGAVGPQGLQGAQGPKGDAGVQGATGAQGLKGESGSFPTITWNSGSTFTGDTTGSCTPFLTDYNSTLIEGDLRIASCSAMKFIESKPLPDYAAQLSGSYQATTEASDAMGCNASGDSTNNGGNALATALYLNSSGTLHYLTGAVVASRAPKQVGVGDLAAGSTLVMGYECVYLYNGGDGSVSATTYPFSPGASFVWNPPTTSIDQ